ncbi:MAG: hypothetical protein ABIR11_10180 [Candidatus Limnocylindrales bacterium]
MPEGPGHLRQPDPERSRWIGLAAVGAAAVVAFVLTVGVFLPSIDAIVTQATSVGSRTAAPLPDTILVCNREYAKGSSGASTLESIRASADREPVVVSTDPGCPSGVCLEGGLCLTVVYLNAGPDAYVAFELLEGP